MIDAHAYLYYANVELRLHSGRYKPPSGSVLISKTGIEGWWSSPEPKVTLTERASGNGAHDVSPADIDYAARTVTVHWTAVGDSRADVLRAAGMVSAACSRMVRFRVVDDQSDTFITGYTRPETDATWNNGYLTGTLTIVCPRPERLSWSSHEIQLLPTSRMQGGLSYGANAKGLTYPLSYGLAPGGAQNTGMLVNNGSSTAYPVLTVTGSFPNGVLIQFDGQALEFSGAVGSVPLTLDSRPGARTAFMGGQDVSRQLTRRDWPEVPYGGSLSLRLMSSGSGWVTAVSRDTYI